MTTKAKENKIEACKRRDVPLHALITDFATEPTKKFEVMDTENDTVYQASKKATIESQMIEGLPMRPLHNDTTPYDITHIWSVKPYEKTLEKYRNFFTGRRLMRSLDDEVNTDEMLGARVFDRLREEVRRRPTIPKDEFERLREEARRRIRTRKVEQANEYRGELQVRAYWQNIRSQLQIEGDEESPATMESSEEPYQNTPVVSLSNRLRQKRRTMRPISKRV